MRRRAIAAIASCVVIALALPGCGGTLLEDREELLKALRATQTMARDFTYQETVDGKTRTVKGTFEDDLRYSMLLGEDARGILEMVVSDDTLAVKVFDPTKVPQLQTPPEDPAMLASLEALRRGEWVVDPAGAPPLETVGAGEGVVEVGKDPLADALNSLVYVDVAIKESESVKEWQKEDLQAAYRLGEDTFDPADASLGIKRFDLVRVPIPRAVGGGAADPRPFNFRKMAIYVKNGRIIRVSEEIEWENHIDIARAKREGKPKYLLELLQRLRAGETEIKIRPRKMELKLEFREARVDVPIGFTSSLQGLFAQSANEEPEEGAGSEPSPAPEQQPPGAASPAPAGGEPQT